MNLEERFWVLNSELEPSGETFSDLPPNEEASEVISNRTALYKPQVTPSNILWKSSGTLGHVDNITPLSYICERGEFTKHTPLSLSEDKCASDKGTKESRPDDFGFSGIVIARG